MALRMALVAEQERRPVQHTDQQAFTTIIEKISRSGTASYVTMGQGCSGTHSDLLEFSIAKVSEQQRTFSVSDAKRILIHLRIHMPIADKKILPAIVLAIEKLTPQP